MRRFILTSPLITGSVELLYTEPGIIAKVDFTAAAPAPGIIKNLLMRLSQHYTLPDMEKLIEGTQASIVETDFEISYKMFWDAYDKKINNKRCEALWEKLSKANQLKAWQGVAAYKKFLAANTWRKQADPEKYLREQYWENEWK